MSFSCLFADVSPRCAGRTREHTIPEALGGTRKSRDSICDSCNHYFGNVLDPILSHLFEPVLHQLGPIISGPMRHKVVMAKTMNMGLPLRLEAGGVAGLRKVVERIENGKRVLYGPRRDLVEKVAKARGIPMGRLEQAPLPEHARGDVPEHVVKLGESITQAATKILFVVLDDQCQRLGAPAYARHPALVHMRRDIRNEAPRWFIRRGGSHPIFDAADLLDDYFGRANALSFWNRTVVVYDGRQRRLAALLQVASTVPLGFHLTVDLGPASFTFSFAKDLLRPAAPIESFKRKVVVDPVRISERRFLCTTQHAIEFGFRQMQASIADVHGRAVVALDLRTDMAMIALATYGLAQMERPELSLHDIAIVAIVEVLKLRFTRHSVKNEQWRQIEVRVRRQVAKLVGAPAVRVALSRDETFGPWSSTILAVFRKELLRLVEEYGSPRVFFPISTNVVPLRL
jgi:hypothetical protein